MFDLVSLIKAAGYLGLFGIIFAESGLFLGFFLPGDSLLFTAGFLASQDFFDIRLLVLIMFIGAVFGYHVGYLFGRKLGYKIFSKEDSLLFHKDHIERSRVFFEKHGGKAIILARFIPIVRTFIPILAGVGAMKLKLFVFYNLAGGTLWAVGVTLFGYYLSNLIPDADRYIVLIVLLIVVISSMPTAVQILKNPKSRDKIRDWWRKRFSRG